MRTDCILTGVKNRVLGVLAALMSMGCAGSMVATGQAAGTYASVAPILQHQCASCHSPQGGAPFDLQSYDDAKQWSGQILEVTQSRYMPPWLPAPGKGEFVGERRLSDQELAAIRAWVSAGAPGGAAAPSSPAAAPASEWTLGSPDTILTSAAPVSVPGSGTDIFMTVSLPAGAAQGHRLRAIAIRPSEPQAVRGVLLTFDPTGTAVQDPGSLEPPVANMSGNAGLIFWQPGTAPVELHAGEQWPVTAKTNLLLQAHLKTTGRTVDLKFQVGLYYERGATRPPATAHVVRYEHKGAINLPTGAATTTLEDSVPLTAAMQVTAIYPRAHFLARSFDVYATTSAGRQIWLLSIPRWDPDWVEVYRYKQPVQLPKGATLHWRVVYDNSSENPHNPSDPPETVHGGPGAKDEADAVLLETRGSTR